MDTTSWIVTMGTIRISAARPNRPRGRKDLSDMTGQAYPPPVSDGRADAVAPGVRRILAPNPGPMTHRGTNSYLVGTGAVAVIDPGPADARHLAALMAALAPGERIVAILVTHPHLDHSAAAPALAAATGAPVMGFGPPGSGLSATMARLAAAGLTGAEGIDVGFCPDRLLVDGEEVAAGDTRLVALHTPGHLGGASGLCPWGDALHRRSGDGLGHVRWSRRPKATWRPTWPRWRGWRAGRWDRLLPGHGPEVTAPAERLAELIAHRRLREAEVRAALAEAPATCGRSGGAHLSPTHRLRLLPAAARNVLAHLIDLSERGLARSDAAPGPEARFHPA